jgi:hypothetical protein
VLVEDSAAISKVTPKPAQKDLKICPEIVLDPREVNARLTKMKESDKYVTKNVPKI